MAVHAVVRALSPHMAQVAHGTASLAYRHVSFVNCVGDDVLHQLALLLTQAVEHMLLAQKDVSEKGDRRPAANRSSSSGGICKLAGMPARHLKK